MRKGSRHSEETRMKMSFAKRGERNPGFGKHRPPVVCEKIRQALSGEKSPLFGKHLPPETCAKMRLARLGEKNSQWKGGRRLNYGCLQIYVGPKQTYKLESRRIMERYLGRELRVEEIVHHINRNPSNNKIENLQLFANQSEHMKFHRAQQRSE